MSRERYDRERNVLGTKSRRERDFRDEMLGTKSSERKNGNEMSWSQVTVPETYMALSTT